jgi:hypothetical protein
MSSGGLNAGIEILKLARLTGCAPHELDYLDQREPQDIRDLREQVTGVRFEADRQLLQRIAAGSTLRGALEAGPTPRRAGAKAAS